jgi:hypothetical protein
METGERGAISREFRDLCGLYCVTDLEEWDHLAWLACQSKEQRWWQNCGLENSSPFVGLERAAISTKYYQTSLCSRIAPDRRVCAGCPLDRHTTDCA